MAVNFTPTPTGSTSKVNFAPAAPNHLDGFSVVDQHQTSQRDFLGNLLPGAFAAGGGILGGIAGGAGGFGVGAVPGAIAGATAGGALGEGIEQKIEEVAGQRKALDPVQITESGATSGALEAGGAGIGAVAKPFLGPVVQATKSVIAKGLSFLSGFAPDVVTAALSRTPGAVTTAAGGEPELNTIVKNTAAKLSDFANTTLQTAKDTVADLSKLSGGGAGYPGTRQAILDTGRKFVSNITDSLRSNLVGVQSDGTLLFNRATFPSNIVSHSDQSAIQDAFNLVKGIGKDTSIENIDAVLNRMITLKTKTPAGTPTGGETQKLINNMMGEVVKFTRSLGDVSPAYGKYADFLDENLPNRVFINEAKELFGTSKNLSAKETSQIATRLLGLFNSGKSAVKEFAGQVGAKLGTDPVGGAAGTLINAGDQVSVRAQNLTRRGVLEKALEAIPRAVVRRYVSSGNLIPLSTHPAVLKAATALGVSSKIVAQDIAGLFEGRHSI